MLTGYLPSQAQQQVSTNKCSRRPGRSLIESRPGQGRPVTEKLVPPKIGPGGPLLLLSLVPSPPLEKSGLAEEYWSTLNLFSNWPRHGTLVDQFEQWLSSLLGNLLYTEYSLTVL